MKHLNAKLFVIAFEIRHLCAANLLNGAPEGIEAQMTPDII